MDRLSEIGRKHLPDGYWGGTAGPAGNPGEVCLTIDDGPCPHTTPWLLEALEESGVKATFFLIGQHAARHEHLVEKIAAAGHTIGNHSFHHHFLPALHTRALEDEIDRTNDQIKAITGRAPELFRPPYGLMDSRAASCLKERGMEPVYWGPVPEDWELPGARSVVRRVMRRISNGSLIVLHERGLLSRQTISAAKEIICKANELGYRFVSVPQLMAKDRDGFCQQI